ncbi:MAG: PP2C family protein-serine/threonine phosphatase [Thermonemataceae bacterium]|nr:PP2C family protein-serine/threonine phosphatase [Thermonemataceae bacterium]
MLFLILLVIGYFVFLIIFYYQKGLVFFDVGYSVFVAGLLSFVGIYIFISMLVLIFNLPTSTVYKKKIEEILSFQQLTQSLQVGESIEAIYQALLENAINITQAEAGYVLVSENSFTLNHQISQEQQKNINHYLSEKHKEILTLPYQVLSEENIEGFESLMLLNLYEKKGENIAKLVLLKKYEEGFNSEHQELLDTFAKQVSISIENYKLLEQVIEKEKLQQELDIAEKVQKSLLPRNLFVGHNIEICAISESAKSVGGDYYDIFNISPTRSYIIIGDVSGKGTSAAFNMAQMKGIFQSLAHLDMPPAYFLFYANQAVSKCFEKASFITITLLLIDAEKESLSIARAGHCPTLYHKAQTKETFYIQDKGLGLGIIRNKNFKKHIVTQEINYQKGDTILLYTDGISEAKNLKDDEYGYDRLKYFLNEHIELPPAQIQEKLITDVHLFCEGLSPHDDYTSLLIRF